MMTESQKTIARYNELFSCWLFIPALTSRPMDQGAFSSRIRELLAYEIEHGNHILQLDSPASDSAPFVVTMRYPLKCVARKHQYGGMTYWKSIDPAKPAQEGFT